MSLSHCPEAITRRQRGQEPSPQDLSWDEMPFGCTAQKWQMGKAAASQRVTPLLLPPLPALWR